MLKSTDSETRLLFYRLYYKTSILKSPELHSELLTQCRNGDRKAQLALYRKYAEAMYGLAFRFVRNPADAEDITQEAFIRAFEKINQYKGEVTFGAWLKRIVINGCIDFQKRKAPRFVNLDEAPNRCDDPETDESDIEQRLQVVRDTISKLPDKYRFVVQLYYAEGYDHAEIAKILGMSENTCRTRLMRGKNRLQELLKNKGEWNKN